MSVDPNVIGRMVFRKGGSLGPTARLDTTLWDNTTTQTEISIVDELTGRLLGGDDIPSGTIRVPLGAKFCDKLFNNRAILFRDPSNLRRIYWSNPGFFYAWSELQALDFASEVTDVYVIGGILYVNTLNSMIQIQNDLGNITGQDLQEQGHTLPSMTPFGSCAVDDQRGIPSHDGFYLSAGYQHSRISDPVKNYFVGTAYTQSSIRSVYSQKHLYVSVITSGGTRTLLDCYVPEMAWRTSAYIANSFCVLDAPGDSLQIYYGSTDGYIYPMNPGTYAVAPILESRDFMPSSPFEELVIRGVDVIAKSLSASPGYLNFKFRVNQVLNDSIILTFPNFSAVVFSGSGLNDMTCDATELGTYNLTDPEFFTVRISTVAGTDKFDWTSDGRTWTIGVSCAATNTLEDHITITWGAITGHTIGDTWTFCPSHLKSTYSLHRQIIQGVQSYVKGNMIGVRIYGGVASKQWSVKAIRLFGEIQEISTLFETL